MSYEDHSSGSVLEDRGKSQFGLLALGNVLDQSIVPGQSAVGLVVGHDG